jgi:hypothetical protein
MQHAQILQLFTINIYSEIIYKRYLNAKQEGSGFIDEESTK